MNKHIFLALALSAMLAPAAMADLQSDLDAAAAVTPGNHAGWIIARNKLVAAGEGAIADLAAAAAPEKWTQQGWPRALAAEVARLRITQPELAEKVDSPRGINPEFYTITRLGKPFCRRDFAQLRLEGAPLLLERWRWLLEWKPFSEGDAGKLEREALATSLLEVPGQVGDTRARFAMHAVLLNPELPQGWRQCAAVSYGQTGGEAALVTLGQVIDTSGQPLAVREAAAWALGRVAERAAVESIKTRINDERITGGQNGPAMTRALVNGIAILGSAWGWKARGAEQKEKADDVRKECALLLLEILKKHPTESEAVSGALVQVVWPESYQWLEDLSKNKDATEAARAAATGMLPTLKAAIAREG